MLAVSRISQAVDAGSLQQLSPFRALGSADCAIVASEIAGYRYHAATALPYPDDPPGTLYLVGSGRVHLSRSRPDGEAVLLLSLSAGDCFRLSARDGAGQFRSVAMVVEEGLIYSLPSSWLHVGVEAQLAIERAVNAQLLRQLLELGERVTEMAFYDIRERVQRTLQRLAGDLDQPLIPITQAELAEMVGTRREYMTKVLKGLKAAGIVSYHRGQRGIRLLRRYPQP